MLYPLRQDEQVWQGRALHPWHEPHLLLLALAIVSRRLHFLIEDQVWNSCAQYKLHLYNCIEDHFITKIRCYSGEEVGEKKGYNLGGGGGVGVFHTKALPSAGDKLSGINH